MEKELSLTDIASVCLFSFHWFSFHTSSLRAKMERFYFSSFSTSFPMFIFWGYQLNPWLSLANINNLVSTIIVILTYLWHHYSYTDFTSLYLFIYNMHLNISVHHITLNYSYKEEPIYFALCDNKSVGSALNFGWNLKHSCL